MGRLVLCMLLGISLWVGVTVWREGPEHAFGGLFAMLASPQYGETDAAPGRSQRLAEEALGPEAANDADAPDASWWSGK
jgi:hypothetical protein